jgi:hypothetical protein
VHLLFLPGPSGYRFLERTGEPPAPGDRVAIAASEEHSFAVAKVGRSPLPGDERPCVYLLP